jgi:hypothetical protein
MSTLPAFVARVRRATGVLALYRPRDPCAIVRARLEAEEDALQLARCATIG